MGERPHRRLLPPARRISPERVSEPNPAKTGEVEVRSVTGGRSATRMALEHRGFARHGAGCAGYRAGMDPAEGWTKILDRYVAAVTRSGDPLWSTPTGSRRS